MNKKGISSIVITDEGKQVVGIVTKTDLCFHFSLFPSHEKVSDYMTRKIFKVNPMHSVFLVSSILAKHGISRVPVVDSKLRGMITLSDVVRTSPTMRPEFIQPDEHGEYGKPVLGPMAKLTAMTALDLMTSRTFTISPDEPLSRAAELMIEHGISGLPVVDSKSRVLGIITKTDIIRAIAA
jgi:CBS domain-containing protein